jgi:hypothetical protein
MKATSKTPAQDALVAAAATVGTNLSGLTRILLGLCIRCRKPTPARAHARNRLRRPLI